MKARVILAFQLVLAGAIGAMSVIIAQRHASMEGDEVCYLGTKGKEGEQVVWVCQHGTFHWEYDGVKEVGDAQLVHFKKSWEGDILVLEHYPVR